MKVGVVIVNHDQKELLRACLRSWAAESYAGKTLLVSDNASTDGAVEMLRGEFPGVKVLAHPGELGFAGAANAGLAELAKDHDFLFLTTNDTEVDPGLLTRLVAAAQADPKLAALGPKILFHAQPGLIWHAGGFIHPFFGNPGHYGFLRADDGAFDAPRECAFVSGCGVLLRTAAAAPLGFLRPELAFYAEDSDLCLRLKAQGWKVGYVPAARMAHRVSATLGVGSPLSTYYITRNSLALLARHRIWSLPGFAAVVLPWRALKALVSGRFSLLRAMLLGARDWMTGRYGMREPKDPGRTFGEAV